jgi:hypothetical protein
MKIEKRILLKASLNCGLWYAPPATAATRAPYAIYLKYRLEKKQNQERTKSSRGHFVDR